MDPWYGCGNAFRLPLDLIQYLSNASITYLEQIANPEHSNIFTQAWKSVIHLGIPDNWHPDWLSYTNALTESHVRIIDGEDELIWAHAKHGNYTPKDRYPIIYSAHKPPVIDWW